jgi:hypothetical protein
MTPDPPQLALPFPDEGQPKPQAKVTTISGVVAYEVPTCEVCGHHAVTTEAEPVYLNTWGGPPQIKQGFVTYLCPSEHPCFGPPTTIYIDKT